MWSEEEVNMSRKTSEVTASCFITKLCKQRDLTEAEELEIGLISIETTSKVLISMNKSPYLRNKLANQSFGKSHLGRYRPQYQFALLSLKVLTTSVCILEPKSLDTSRTMQKEHLPLRILE